MESGPDLTTTSTGDLLAGYARTLAELRRRKVVRTNNAPAGDYAEWLVQRALGGTLAPNSEKSHDVTLDDGRTAQVKARVVRSPPLPGETQTSPFRSWHFDLGVFVLLDAADYRPVLGVVVPVEIVREHAKPRPHVNGDIVFIRPPMTTAPGVIDVTAKLVEAAGLVVDPAPMGEPSGTAAKDPDLAQQPKALRRTWHDDEIRVLVAYHHMYGPRGGGRANLRPLCALFGLPDDDVNKLERQGDSINFVLGGGGDWSASARVQRLALVPREQAIADGERALERLRHLRK